MLRNASESRSGSGSPFRFRRRTARLVLSENAEFTYKCSDFYHPNDEGGLIWNDKDINVEWPIPEGMELIFSDKDQKWGSFEEYKNR